MKIAEIIVGERFRKDLGDLDSLCKSIQEIGLLHPVVVDEDNNLIAGLRRIEAYKKLGREDIPVRTIDLKNSLAGEYAENAFRKDFTPSEAVAIWQAMESYQLEGRPCSESERGRRIKRASKLLGLSTDSLSKAKQVVDSGDQELIEEMDRTGKILRVYTKLEVKREKERIAEITPNIEIRRGDFKDVLADVYNIDAIITEPPYTKEYLYCYSDLAKFASKHLKEDGWLAAYAGILFLPEIINRLSEHLTYVWTFCIYFKGCNELFHHTNILCGWRPVLLYSRGNKKMRFPAFDAWKSEEREKDKHEWQQSKDSVRPLIHVLTEPGGLVVDPFAGTGTFGIVAKELGRNFIGAEINKD